MNFSFTHPGQRNAVNRTLVFHFSPPKAAKSERDQLTSHFKDKDTNQILNHKENIWSM